MTRLRSTRAASSDGKVTVQGSSRLMDDYVYASDLTGETDLTVVQQADGSYSLLYLGADGGAMSLRQDPKSDTGWFEENLDGSLQPNQVAGAVDASGKFIAFATGVNAAAPDLYTATRQSDGKWSIWQRISVDPRIVPPFMRVMNLAAFTIAGKVELFALLAPSPGRTGYTSLWRIDWSAAAPGWHTIANTDRNIIESCTIAGKPGILFATLAASDPTRADLFTLAAPFTGEPARLAAEVALTTLAVGTQADKNSAVFIADTGYLSDKRQIQYLDGGKPAAGFTQIDTTIAARALAVGNAGATELALFALDEKSLLHFIAYGAGKNSDFFLNFAGLLTATGKDGEAELIGYVPGKGLRRMWKSPRDPKGLSDPTGDGGGWTHETIQYQPANQKKPTQQNTYATTLTFYDDKGVVISDSELHLRSTEIVSANVAGEVRVLGPNHPVACRTDGAGRVRITTPTDTLNVAGLSARMPELMLVEEDFAIAPNYEVHERLRKITEDDVKKIVPPAAAASAAHIKNAVQDSMAHIPVVRLAASRVGGRADLRTPLSLREQPGPAFRFTVADGQAVHRRLTPEEAEAAIAEIGAGAPDGLFQWFEDMIEAVRNAFQTAAKWVYDYVVTPVANGFRLVLNFIADGVKLVWNGIIDTVEAAFRLAETVFEAVKTAFVRLYQFYGWLLSGNVCKEIWATKQQFERVFNQGITALAGYARQGAPVSHAFFAQMETVVGQKFAEIETALGTTDANQAIDAKPAAGGSNTLLELMEDALSVATWLIDKLTPSFGSFAGVNINIPDNLLRDAKILFGDIQAAFVNEIVGLINACVRRIQSLATSTEEFGNRLLATIVGEAKDLILAVLRFVDGVVQKVLTFFADHLVELNTLIFGAKINISLVQALYDLINPRSPEDLTVLGLGSLVCAFVATTLYRLLFGAALFPPDPRDVDVGASNKEIGAMLISAGIIQAIVWCFVDLALDLVPKGGGAPKGEVAMLLGMVVLLQVTIQALTWPGGVGATLKFDTPAATAASAAWLIGFGSPAFKTLWLVGGVFTGLQKGGPRGSVWGSGVVCGLGVLSWIANMKAVWATPTSERTLSQSIIAVCGPLSAIGKPAYHIFPPPARNWVLGISDATSDLGAGIARIVHGAQLIKSGAVLAPASAAPQRQESG